MIVEADIIKLFGFTSRDDILKWGENFVQYHSNCTFEDLKQVFCKYFQTMKNEEPLVISWQMGRSLLRTFAKTCQLFAHQSF
jgi:hypothetical protein